MLATERAALTEWVRGYRYHLARPFLIPAGPRCLLLLTLIII